MKWKQLLACRSDSECFVSSADFMLPRDFPECPGLYGSCDGGGVVQAAAFRTKNRAWPEWLRIHTYLYSYKFRH